MHIIEEEKHERFQSVGVGLCAGRFAGRPGRRGAVNIETVPVGNPGNVADTRYASPGFGSVSYTYNIGKYEVTAGQYTEFLNAVAATDTYGLYTTNMWSDTQGCKILRSGSAGSYTYSVGADWANRPVNYVSWGDAARFANWMANGQPSGAQGLSTTEDGSYYLNGATSSTALMAVTRKPGATWVIPTEDEWYKAGYYKGGSTNAGYWEYPTTSDTAPGQDMADVSGNNANYYTAPYTHPINSPYYTTVAGEFQNSDSPYGTFDQGGNVWEWNEAVLYGSYRGLRGGSFAADDNDISGLHASYRANYDPTYLSDYFGFRVSAVPEPGSAGIMLLGIVGLLRRRCPWCDLRSRCFAGASPLRS